MIDYSQSVRDIYTHTARHIISTSKKLDIICVKQHDIDQYGLPSWAPDWTRPPKGSGAMIVGLHHRQPEFTAAGNSSADVQFLAGGYVLKTPGVIIDTIKTLGMSYKKKPGPPSDVLPALEVFHDWWNLFVGTHSNTITAQALFGRVISCGNWEFQDHETYASKLEAIFALSDELLSDSDMLRLDPPSRSSTGTMGNSTSSLGEEDDDLHEDDEERTQLSAMLSAGLTMNRRRMFLSQSNLVGLAPADANQKDIICVLLGCRYPVILRPQGDHHILVGEAYVEEFMNGEAMIGLKEGSYSLEAFEIR